MTGETAPGLPQVEIPMRRPYLGLAWLVLAHQHLLALFRGALPLEHRALVLSGMGDANPRRPAVEPPGRQRIARGADATEPRPRQHLARARTAARGEPAGPADALPS